MKLLLRHQQHPNQHKNQHQNDLHHNQHHNQHQNQHHNQQYHVRTITVEDVKTVMLSFTRALKRRIVTGFRKNPTSDAKMQRSNFSVLLVASRNVNQHKVQHKVQQHDQQGHQQGHQQNNQQHHLLQIHLKLHHLHQAGVHRQKLLLRHQQHPNQHKNQHHYE